MTPFWSLYICLIVINGEQEIQHQRGPVCYHKQAHNKQRTDTINPLSYNQERTKSYCDRVLIGIYLFYALLNV